MLERASTPSLNRKRSEEVRCVYRLEVPQSNFVYTTIGERTAAERMRTYARIVRSLSAGADAVLQNGSAVGGDRHIELRRPGRRLRVLVTGIDHFPVAADWLIHFNSDR